MIKNILFDLDNTLFNFYASEKKALKKTLIHLGLNPDESMLKRYSEINLEHWKRLEKGELTRSEVKVGRYRQFFEEFGVDASPEETTAFYEIKLSEEGDLMDGALELLQYLKGKYRLYVASNGTLVCQQGRMKNTGITNFFDAHFISQQIGFEKPQAEFFDYCFANIPDFKKNETILIGDSITADIIGGKNTGIKTVWFNPNGEKSHLPDYEIHALSELKILLERI
ncbi:MAG: YjjG family noncanonical pyrimidine nucleotidase [Clostridia bacterium]|nr:YjjG family noncanonical pyrimidine nucleotidase [Clostridia bacterium]